MIPTSAAYKAAIKGDTRKTVPLVICEFNPALQGYPFAQATATSEQVGYEAAQAVDGRIRQVDYLSAGYVPAEIRGVHPGWCSSGTSNGAGVLSESITIQYAASIRNKNYFIVAPPTCYPVDFTIEVSADGAAWQTVTSITGNTEAIFSFRDTSTRAFQYCRIAITRISASSSPAKVLQCGAVTTIVFDLYDSDTMKLTEELGQTSTASPLALVSSNWIEFALSNEARLTDQDNSSSFLYKLLGKNFRFRPMLGVRTVLSPETIEFVPLGVYWNKIDELSTVDITSQFVGYDRMSQLKDRTPPILSVQHDTTIYELFALLFSGLGLSPGEYRVDPELVQPVPCGFFAGEVGSNFSGETVGELLQVLSEAGNAYVTCDRFGRIVVRSNFLQGDPLEALTDNDWIYSVKKLRNESDNYDKIRVRYRVPTGLAPETSLYSSEVVIPPGGTSIDVEFPDAVGEVTRVVLDGASTAEVAVIYPGAVYSRIAFTNPAATNDTATLTVYGKLLQFVNTSLDRTFLDETIEPSQKLLAVSNWLIQSKDVALEYGNTLLQFADVPVNKYEISERGNPARESGDLVALSDTTNGIANDIQITKQIMTWKGTLSCVTTGRNKLLKLKWVFLSSSFPVLMATTRERECVTAFLSSNQTITVEKS